MIALEHDSLAVLAMHDLQVLGSVVGPIPTLM